MSKVLTSDYLGNRQGDSSRDVSKGTSSLFGTGVVPKELTVGNPILKIFKKLCASQIRPEQFLAAEK
jgi:hypothetical protein